MDTHAPIETQLILRNQVNMAIFIIGIVWKQKTKVVLTS